MRFRVLVLRRAADYVQRIYDWLHERSPAGAIAWFASFNAALDRLEEGPEHFALAAESPRRNVTIRESYFRTRRGRTYRLLFAIVGADVRVMHVLGSGQSFPDDLG
jgi:plasmid stabilization system protein ParE